MSDRVLVWAIALALFLVISGSTLIIWNNNNQSDKNRAAYLECLRITELLLKENPNRIGVPHCSSPR